LRIPLSGLNLKNAPFYTGLYPEVFSRGSL
jgi:hypothetical protein